jgi:hypothetical protein
MQRNCKESLQIVKSSQFFPWRDMNMGIKYIGTEGEGRGGAMKRCTFLLLLFGFLCLPSLAKAENIATPISEQA